MSYLNPSFLSLEDACKISECVCLFRKNSNVQVYIQKKRSGKQSQIDIFNLQTKLHSIFYENIKNWSFSQEELLSALTPSCKIGGSNI